jgi:hypothetical protein
MIFLQDVAQKLPNSAPESSFSFWFISQVVITAVIFIGVYYILKPVMSNKDDTDKHEYLL